MPDTATSDARPRPRITAWGLVLAALILLTWARFLIFPSLVAGNSLDHSWMQALGRFYRTSAQVGTDYVFTYGPLGYFATEVYDGQLYWQRYLWELLVKLAAAIVIIGALARLPGRGLTLLGAVLVMVFVPYHFDTIYQVTLLAAGVLLIDEACRGRAWIAGIVPLLALLALTKFTYFILALWAVVLAELAVRLRGYRGWLSPAPLYLAAVLAIWLFCGQNPLHLWAYCRNSWEISQGYSEAMSASGEAFDVGLAAVTMILAILLLLLAGWRYRRSVFHVTIVLFLGPGLFLGWKNGLIRHDGHPFIFFGMAMFVALMLPRLLEPATSGLTGMFVGCLLACSVAGTLLTDDRVKPNFFQWNVIEQTEANVTAALHPVTKKDELEAERSRREGEWSLDRVHAEVGDAPLDQLSCEQGVVLLNGLNWHPRPVFQSYTAYTPALLRLNADYYRSPAAPDYLLCSINQVDARLGAMEDSLALREILRRYYPVMTERQFVLFQRVPPGEETPPAEPEVVCRRTVRFDEEVSLEDVPGEHQLLSLHFTPSIRGHLWGACFKRDRLFLELRLASGATLRRRLVPALAQEGFLINPLMNTTGDLVRLYGPSSDRVLSFRVIPASTDFKDEIEMTKDDGIVERRRRRVSTDYKDEIEMTVSVVPRLPCRTLDAATVDALLPR
jgi:hypothetical protein